MDKKKAFVFDTNFIIQNQRLDETLKKLEENFSIYVTQVSIDERIAQERRNTKLLFDEAEKLKGKTSHFVNINFTKTYEDECWYIGTGMQKKYERLFEDRIIPFHPGEDTLNAVVERANMKIPPFIDNANASDKGFKDSLLWLSMLSYFKDNGESEILFISDDGGFNKNCDALQKEFQEETGKAIEIRPNTYYKELLDEPRNHTPVLETTPEKLPGIDRIRTEIEDVFDSLCEVCLETENSYDKVWVPTFRTTVQFSRESVATFFAGLHETIVNHLFESDIPASEVFNIDNHIEDCASIPIQDLEDALKLYNNISKNYAEYCDQFFDAVAKILNQNYVDPSSLHSDFADPDEDDELPF